MNSITAGMSARRAAIYLGESGLLKFQIVDRATTAIKYNPDAIEVMAGTNDAIRGDLDRLPPSGIGCVLLRAQTLVIVTLAPHGCRYAVQLRGFWQSTASPMLRRSTDFARMIDLNPELAPPAPGAALHRGRRASVQCRVCSLRRPRTARRVWKR